MTERVLSGEGPVSSEAAFRLLTADSDNGPSLRETDVSVSAGYVAHALIEQGRPALLVPVDAGTQVPRDTHSQGVDLGPRVLLDGSAEEMFLQLSCTEPTLGPTFAALCDDILVALTAAPRGNSVPVCVGVLDAWRSLLRPRPSEVMNRSAVLGLLAELHVLERLLMVDPDALDRWQGPSGHRHDFVTDDVVIEVKASTGADRFTVEIHGDRQLEGPVGGRLVLYAERFEAGGQDSDSLPDVVDRVRRLGVSAHDLLTRLAYVGYDSKHMEIYRTMRFRTREIRIYDVEADFPAVVPGAFRDPTVLDALSNVNYAVDLDSSGVVPFRRDGDVATLLSGRTA
ncbi:PD-(D/E)XK motif protein [Kineococcus sp. GCM10028916]|uniref:PD-(D/E)XK motif protein n=1 Tax=Kineococcus sp. GCM10028916 TaxID=3273394 RepID=UPI0036D23798